MNKNLTSMIDKVASSLEEKGLKKEAEKLDMVANTVESMVGIDNNPITTRIPPAVDIIEQLITIGNLSSSLRTNKDFDDILKDLKKKYPKEYAEASNRSEDDYYSNISPDTPDMSVEGSYIIISEDILDYDNMSKEAGKKKRKRIKKWIPNLQEGGLHKDLGVPEGKDIPKEMIDKKYKALQKKAEGDKKLSESDSKLFKRLQFAINARGFKKSKK